VRQVRENNSFFGEAGAGIPMFEIDPSIDNVSIRDGHSRITGFKILGAAEMTDNC
jgi:hypothetical protein